MPKQYAALQNLAREHRLHLAEALMYNGELRGGACALQWAGRKALNLI